MNDQGPNPYVVNIESATIENETFRTTVWTGKNLQLTVMSVKPGDTICLEVHQEHDQFLRIEQGQALVKMGPSKDQLDFVQNASTDDAIFVPAGMWHTIINDGENDLKLYSIYAPPEHAHGTVHVTKQDDPESCE